MLLRPQALAQGLALISLIHCGGKDETELSEPVHELTLVTFNTAIGSGFAPYADQRLDSITTALPGLGADVVCLQELWRPEDLTEMAEALRGEFPHSHRSVVSAGSEGAGCTTEESELLADCVEENCADVDEAGLPLCAVASCAGVFQTQVSESCRDCIASNQSLTDVDALVAICAADDDGEAAAYENQTGLLLLSKHPLEALDYLPLVSSLADRGVLAARIDTDFVDSVDVYCTHLAASLGDVPYTGMYGSFQGERVQQIGDFLDWVEQTRAPGGGAALLGDMNCGPETALARSASPDAFARFADAGFEYPYAEADGRCTFCANNPLNGFAEDGEEGAVIDHVLLSGFDASLSVSASRVLDEGIDIEADGESVATAHSDHYGVRVSVSGAEAAP